MSARPRPATAAPARTGVRQPLRAVIGAAAVAWLLALPLASWTRTMRWAATPTQSRVFASEEGPTSLPRVSRRYSHTLSLPWAGRATHGHNVPIGSCRPSAVAAMVAVGLPTALFFIAWLARWGGQLLHRSLGRRSAWPAELHLAAAAGRPRSTAKRKPGRPAKKKEPSQIDIHPLTTPLYLRLVFDGTTIGNPGSGGCGAVLYAIRLRGRSPVKLWMGNQFLGPQVEAIKADYHGLILGLTAVTKRFMRPDLLVKLEIDGDNIQVLQQIASQTSTTNLELRPLLLQAYELLNRIGWWQVKHRELSDHPVRLATMAVQDKRDRTWFKADWEEEVFGSRARQLAAGETAEAVAGEGPAGAGAEAAEETGPPEFDVDEELRYGQPVRVDRSETAVTPTGPRMVLFSASSMAFNRPLVVAILCGEREFGTPPIELWYGARCPASFGDEKEGRWHALLFGLEALEKHFGMVPDIQLRVVLDDFILARQVCKEVPPRYKELQPLHATGRAILARYGATVNRVKPQRNEPVANLLYESAREGQNRDVYLTQNVHRFLTELGIEAPVPAPQQAVPAGVGGGAQGLVPLPGQLLHLRLQFDGGARNNPGIAGSGAVILGRPKEGGRPVQLWVGNAYLGPSVTNNTAEYEALLLGLQALHDHFLPVSPVSLEVVGDSELVLRQMAGKYRVTSPHLQTLHAKATALLQPFTRLKFIHVVRAENALANELANQAMDHKKGTAPAVRPTVDLLRPFIYEPPGPPATP